jgi:predicted glycosyltransferase
MIDSIAFSNCTENFNNIIVILDINDVKLEKRMEMSFTDTSTMVTNCVVLT